MSKNNMTKPNKHGFHPVKNWGEKDSGYSPTFETEFQKFWASARNLKTFLDKGEKLSDNEAINIQLEDVAEVAAILNAM